MSTEKGTKKSGVARLLQIAGSRKRLLAISGALAVVHALLALTPYLLIYAVIRSLLAPEPDMALIRYYISCAIACVTGAYVLLYASGMASHVAAFNILYELRKQMADKLGKLPLGFINRNNSGALKKILADDIERIENFIAHTIPDFVKCAVLPLITLGYLFTVDWRLALASCVPIILVAVSVPLMFSKKRMAMLTGYHQSLEHMNTVVVEYIRAMPVVRIFGHTGESFDRYSNAVFHFREMVDAFIRRTSVAYSVFSSFVSNATLPVLAAGLYFYFRNGLELPVLFLFLILGVGYIRPLFALHNLGAQLSVINHGVKRLDEILFQHEQETVGDKRLSDNFSIRFDNVSFSYEEKREALSHVSFQVPQGTVTALVGPSGAGKSTVGQLIARFWDVKDGRILIGGIDIRQIPPEQLMANVSFVFQDSFMFGQSIYENIRMGMDKTEEEIIAAAKAARCHDFIAALPHGYQTHWGSKGVHLSGGEQQRIQLARAILKNAPILILDEATAFSDPENEYLIQQAFSKLIENKTVIVIAHRLSTIVDSDQIIVMENGTVADIGEHAELLNDCEVYRQLWHAHIRAKEFTI
ncbi:MAG TPA: ABC transporter ATP-binding protein [Chitinophaga sp.]|nr:ABC transporter ATP-binding protein [Chitinophaga sp.]